MDWETVPPMIISEEIHHSIADADDIEEVWDREIPVGGIVGNLFRHPLQLITRWNWKSVLLSTIIRGFIYLFIYLLRHEPLDVALTAFMVEFVFRLLTTGVTGSLTQSFRHAAPPWLASLIVSIMLPAFGQGVELLTHAIQDQNLNGSGKKSFQFTFPISMLFAIISTLFNLYAMRNGVLLVGAGEETLTLRNDMKRMPWLIAEFSMSLPIRICRGLEVGRFLNPVVLFISFGIAIGAILGGSHGIAIAILGESGGLWGWTWKTALGAWVFLLVVTILTIIVRRILGHQLKKA